MNKKTTKYDMESLSKLFAFHAGKADEHNADLIASYKENYPDEPLPAHFLDDFSLPLALKAICDAIIEIRKAE